MQQTSVKSPKQNPPNQSNRTENIYFITNVQFCSVKRDYIKEREYPQRECTAENVLPYFIDDDSKKYSGSVTTNQSSVIRYREP